MTSTLPVIDLEQVKQTFKRLAPSFGFADLRVCDIDLSDYASDFQQWLAHGYHGDLEYMAAHGEKRWRPELLVEGTRSIIAVRMDVLPDAQPMKTQLQDRSKAYIARYALGRDYHKVMRKRLTQLAKAVVDECGAFNYRAFVDSAPVLERPIAEKSGLGWTGKNSLTLHPKAGSWFMLGELYIDIELSPDQSFQKNHCGSCTSCIDVCPTDAIVADGVIDARKCISYFTIESNQPIPVEYRTPMGNRIFGCDDCQIFCPWTKFAKFTNEADYQPRNNLDCADLLELWHWDEKTFLRTTEGSAIRRTGYECWNRNLAVALGNAPTTQTVITALKDKLGQISPMVDEHIEWALQKHQARD
ncbi:tRNA epoxyqueuosine(34) reductase QueG [Salinibius halmophilus]|uniref:tRNA epoxyqueuosine(34) reductase QueG n=1 Tax=Salinibius halmophilus TaxID=1853216 RepID=UPI000E676234|nr:tRNA epoxyqueuosine(34) reductase QueG [Salinibius halmophilus]